MIKQLIKNVMENDHSEFRKGYIKVMQDNYDKKKNIVKQYCMKRISLGKETGI